MRSRVSRASLAFMCLAVGVAGMGAAATVAAQGDSAARRAADGVTAAAIARHLQALADDSAAATYIGTQWQAFGLRPETNAWAQRYPVVRSQLKLNSAASQIHCTAASRDQRDTLMTTATFAHEAYSAVDTLVESERIQTIPSDSVVVVSGRQTPATAAGLRGHIVIYLPAPGVDSATEHAIIRQLYEDNLVLVVSRADSATFVRRQQTAANRLLSAVNLANPTRAPHDVAHWAAYVWPETMRGCLERAGVSLDPARADTAPFVRTLPGVSLWSVPRPTEVSDEQTTGVNLVGVLPGAGFSGSDAAADSLERTLVITAPFRSDRRGQAGGAGTDANASGIAVLLEVARAFGQLAPADRPRCSIVFLVPQGGGQFWGSRTWITSNGADLTPMANLNLDQLGGPGGDSLWVDGLHDVDWPVYVNWLTTLYPDFHLTMVDGGSIVNPVSDHFAFVQQAIPSLYFHDDDAGDSSPSTAGAPAARETARLARVAKLLFHLAYQLGNEARQPSWTAEGRRNRLMSLERR